MHILFSGGGTLGPVTPLLAAVDALRERVPGVRVSWIGTEGGPEAVVVAGRGIPFSAIPAGKLRREITLKNLAEPFKVVGGFFRALSLLAHLRPDAVVSAGGFVAVPVVWAAAVRRIPVHVHQQDVRPGLANRLSAPFAVSISVALEKSLADFPAKKTAFTGNPVRPEILRGSREEGLRLFGLEAGVPAILILGGGTGAARLNALVVAALPKLLEAAQVIHVTGKGKMAGAIGRRPSAVGPIANGQKPTANGLADRYHPYEFLDKEMPHAYAAADLVVTRAGMGTLTEISALGLPSVIVPMPGTHQEDNARFFAEKGAAVVFDQESGAERFAETVPGLLGDPERRAAFSVVAGSLHNPDATGRIAEMIIAVAKKRRMTFRHGRSARADRVRTAMNLFARATLVTNRPFEYSSHDMPASVSPDTLRQVKDIFARARARVEKLLAERRALYEKAVRKQDEKLAAELRERLEKL